MQDVYVQELTSNETRADERQESVMVLGSFDLCVKVG